MKCPIENVFCEKHGFVHGKEAEELRAGIEIIQQEEYWDVDVQATDVFDALRKLLDRVDARDSLAWREEEATPKACEYFAIKGPRCDFQKCEAPPVWVCRCRRCVSEPEESEHFFSCASPEHLEVVEAAHRRIRGRICAWLPFTPKEAK